MATTVTYTTIAGDRWDTVAHKAWGDALRYPELIAQNVNTPVYDIFPAGVVLQVPVITTDEATVSYDELPPWKQ